MKVKYPSNYQTFYDAIATEDIKNDIVPAYYRTAQRKKLLAYIGSVKGKAVLDVGVGKDCILKYIAGCQRKAGVDISSAYLVRLPRDIEVCQVNAEEMKFNNEFDVVICSDILEHVLHPDTMLKKIRQAMNTNAQLIIRSPYKEELASYVGTKWEGCHLRTFDDLTLRNLLENNGFTVKRLIHDGFDIDVHKCSKNLILRNRVYAALRIRFRTSIPTLPNWLALMLGFKPIEIVAIAAKR
jgi:hypothetical protein